MTHTIPTPLMLARQAGMRQHPSSGASTSTERREQEEQAWAEHDQMFSPTGPGDILLFRSRS